MFVITENLVRVLLRLRISAPKFRLTKRACMAERVILRGVTQQKIQHSVRLVVKHVTQSVGSCGRHMRLFVACGAMSLRLCPFDFSYNEFSLFIQCMRIKAAVKSTVTPVTHGSGNNEVLQYLTRPKWLKAPASTLHCLI